MKWSFVGKSKNGRLLCVPFQSLHKRKSSFFQDEPNVALRSFFYFFVLCRLPYDTVKEILGEER